MPLRPTCADPNCSDTINVTVFLKGATNKELWIDVANVAWLITYAADEIAYQGVECKDEGTAVAAKTPNCKDVEHLHIAWNFQSKNYDAEFLGGPEKGYGVSIDTVALTETAVWKHNEELSHLQSAKSFAKELLKQMCKAHLEDSATGVQEFVATNGLEKAVSIR